MLGSLGDNVGRKLAEALGYEYADREVISAAERFGEGPLDLIHVTEEKPRLLERVRANERHYAAAVEAILLEKAARDNVVLCGRGAAFFLSRFPHVLRVRVTAPEDVRAQLRQWGHELLMQEDWTMMFGGGQGIMVDPDSGALMGGADPRRSCITSSLTRSRSRSSAVSRSFAPRSQTHDLRRRPKLGRNSPMRASTRRPRQPCERTH